MKAMYFSAILLVISISDNNIIAQDNRIGLFTSKIDSLISEMSGNTSGLVIRKRLNNRNIRIIGMFQEEQYIFTQRIKFYKGGIKKERIIVRKNVAGIDPLLMKIVLINGEYFYIKNNTYSSYEKTQKITKEHLVDGKIYRIIKYNYDDTEMSRDVNWQINKPKK